MKKICKTANSDRFAYRRNFFCRGNSRRLFCIQARLFLHALRFFLQGGSRRPPAPPRGATGTFVLLACTRFMAFGWLDSCGAILHPASAFYGESRALYCATTAASGGSLPRNPLAPQLTLRRFLGRLWEFLGIFGNLYAQPKRPHSANHPIKKPPLFKQERQVCGNNQLLFQK